MHLKFLYHVLTNPDRYEHEEMIVAVNAIYAIA